MKCPVCKGHGPFRFIEKWERYTIQQCPVCDAMFCDPFKNPGADWYEHSEMYAVGRYLNVNLSWHHQRFLEEPLLGRTLLDVGCGTGIFLSGAEKLGYEPWGLDFSRHDIRIGRDRYGLKHLYVESMESFAKKYKKRKFDVITFFEVIEHVDDPPAFLKQVRSLLKPHGRIAFSTPNRERFFDTLGVGDYPPNHLTRWNERALRGLLERGGFEVEKVVVKDFAWDEVASYIKSHFRLGIARSMAKKGLDRHDESQVERAATLMKIKDFAARAVALPVAAVLKLFPLQGSGLVCIARLK